MLGFEHSVEDLILTRAYSKVGEIWSERSGNKVYVVLNVK